MKGIINEIIQEIKSSPNSVKFWNGLLLVIYILIPIVFGMDIFYLFLIAGSLASLGFIADEWHSDVSHWWVLLFPPIWIGGIVILVSLAVSIGIEKLNNFLDGNKEPIAEDQTELEEEED